MNKEKFSDAMNEIDAKYVDEAIRYTKKRRAAPLIRAVAAAACFCFVIGGVLILRQPELSGKNPVNPSPAGEIIDKRAETVGDDGVAIPPAVVSLAADGKEGNYSCDMIAFFIYQGRVYTRYDHDVTTADESVAGERLGTAVGLIDEWTPADGYVESAGSVSGDFYAVNGFDPSFMLCMKENGGASLYICNNGITLKYGSELFEDRFHLSEGFVGVEYESRESWYCSKGEIRRLGSENEETVNAFIKELNSALFIPTAEVPLDEGDDSIYDKEIYHMYLKTESGITVELRLFDGGVVSCEGFPDVCVQIPEDTFASVVALFNN